MVRTRPDSRNRATARCSSRGDAPISAESAAIVSPGLRLNSSKNRSPSADSSDPARRLLAVRAARGRDGATAGAAALAVANARSTAHCALFRSAATCAATICSICLSNSAVVFVMHDPIARSRRLPQPHP
jgi:hypothetical protein